MHLGEVMGELMPVPGTPEGPATTHNVPAHRRRRARSDFADDQASATCFEESKVPVVTIEVANPEAAGLVDQQYEVIGQKVSHRLAQRPGSYVVLKYVRPVIKRLDRLTLHWCKPRRLGQGDARYQQRYIRRAQALQRLRGRPRRHLSRGRLIARYMSGHSIASTAVCCQKATASRQGVSNQWLTRNFR
jgi:hypothetical protein